MKLHQYLWGFLLFCMVASSSFSGDIPLPEHPRPEFMRSEWINLNGEWDFRFDAENMGLTEKWNNRPVGFNQKINVPFPWGSNLSGVKDEADIAWYTRTIQVPDSWNGKRIFLVIGACDWHTQAWLDGNDLGSHQGGYTPFEFELTPHVKPGSLHQLVLRVDDTEHKFKLYGKQGYGNARGIWQTPYLETRGNAYLSAVHFTPDIDHEKVTVKAYLDEPAPKSLKLSIQFNNANESKTISKTIGKGKTQVEFDINIPNPHLWNLDDPFLYEVTSSLSGGNMNTDEVQSYFGMRKISVMNMPGTEYPYIALNNEPIYLQLALDQAYHPDGFYTFPSDEFTRDEILRSRRIGLNAMRVHVKVPLTRKLYWADKLGMLIMEDVPNSWGEPDENMRREAHTALTQMIKRDFNHPSIFSYVIFNETWGLFSGSGRGRKYLPETQEWVAQMVDYAKSLDSTRLVEDNSACNYDHVKTDMNTWHSYLPGYGWEDFLNEVVSKTHTGSDWNYAEGYQQENQPMLNSEFGNVWGYEGSSGDVDWSWDYHLSVDAFRRHPKIAGWLYTEHHDVINEWNGYYRFDRSEKYTGMDELADGMTLRDLHDPFYIAMSKELCTTVEPGKRVSVPLFASYMTGKALNGNLTLQWELHGWDTLGIHETYSQGIMNVPYQPWMNKALDNLTIAMPQKNAVAVLAIKLVDDAGTVLHHNFTTFAVNDGVDKRDETLLQLGQPVRVLRIEPKSFTGAEWSLKQWDVLDGLKINGAGHGYFEYHVAVPDELDWDEVKNVTFRAELSAKQLFGKDMDEADKISGDFMRGGGTHDPAANRNAYPMTDEETYPSAVQVLVNGESAGVFDLPDDAADHRGILSWHSQKRDRYLREAGSYGYLVSAQIPQSAVEDAKKSGEFVIRLVVDEGLPHGLAIYGEKFGRYALDPSLLFSLN